MAMLKYYSEFQNIRVTMNLEQAIELASDYITHNTGDLDAYAIRGLWQIDSGRVNNGLSDIELVIEQNPAHPLALDIVRDLLVKSGKRIEAKEVSMVNSNKDNRDTVRDAEITFFKRLIHFNPNSAEHQYQLGEFLYSKQDVQQALDTYKRMIEMDPHEWSGHASEIGVALFQHNLFAEAEKALEVVVTQDRDNIDALTNLIITQEKLGKYEEALELLSSSLEKKIGDEAWMHIHKGLIYTKIAGFPVDLNSARIPLQKGNSKILEALEQYPTHLPIDQYNDYMIKAITHFFSAITADPTNPAPYHGLGLILLHYRQFQYYFDIIESLSTLEYTTRARKFLSTSVFNIPQKTGDDHNGIEAFSDRIMAVYHKTIAGTNALTVGARQLYATTLRNHARSSVTASSIEELLQLKDEIYFIEESMDECPSYGAEFLVDTTTAHENDPAYREDSALEQSNEFLSGFSRGVRTSEILPDKTMEIRILPSYAPIVAALINEFWELGVFPSNTDIPYAITIAGNIGSEDAAYLALSNLATGITPIVKEDNPEDNSNSVNLKDAYVYRGVTVNKYTGRVDPVSKQLTLFVGVMGRFENHPFDYELKHDFNERAWRTSLPYLGSNRERWKEGIQTAYGYSNAQISEMRELILGTNGTDTNVNLGSIVKPDDVIYARSVIDILYDDMKEDLRMQNGHLFLAMRRMIDGF